MNGPMTQYAPWPSDLEALVAKTRYRHGWRFALVSGQRDPADTHGNSAGGLTLEITTLSANSHHQAECDHCGTTISSYRVIHSFIVPAATWTMNDWLAWLMDRIEDVELHEAREFFRLEWTDATVTIGSTVDEVSTEKVNRSEQPFAPNHGPGRDPYRRYSYASDEDRRTSFRGITKAE